METSWSHFIPEKEEERKKNRKKDDWDKWENTGVAKLNPSTLVITLIVTGAIHHLTHHIRAV